MLDNLLSAGMKGFSSVTSQGGTRHPLLVLKLKSYANEGGGGQLVWECMTGFGLAGFDLRKLQFCGIEARGCENRVSSDEVV